LEKLVSLLQGENCHHLQEASATVLAHSCSSSPQQGALVEVGAIPPLIFLLSSSQRSSQIAALEALAAISSGNACAASAVLAAGETRVLSSLLSFAKHSSFPRTRFLACDCLTHLFRGVQSSQTRIHGTVGLSRDDVEHAILPILVYLLSEPSVGCEAAPAIILLAAGNLQLQRAAADADAVPRLAALLVPMGEGRGQECSGSNSEPLGQAAVLVALGLLCADHENHRRQLVESGALPLIVSALSDSSSAVQGAACCCMRSLSRSSRLLRNSLGAHGDVVGPLLELSRDVNPIVATEATAALANMAIDYSAVKEQLLRQGGVERFAALAAAGEGMLRLHGVWGLSSVAYLAVPEAKLSIMHHLPWDIAAALLEDNDKAIRVRDMT